LAGGFIAFYLGVYVFFSFAILDFRLWVVLTLTNFAHNIFDSYGNVFILFFSFKKYCSLYFVLLSQRLMIW